MTEEERLKRNAYQRQWYEFNLEKQRKKCLEKYHRNKKSISELTEEEKQKKREQRRLHQKVFYWRERGIEISLDELKNSKMTAKKIRKINSMKKLRLPSRITHKYVSEVLRKFPKSRLCNILISKWTLAELKEFEMLEEEFNKSAN